MSDLGLTDSNIVELAKALTTNSNLKLIDLRGNNFTIVGVQTLLNSVQQNEHLKDVIQLEIDSKLMESPETLGAPYVRHHQERTISETVADKVGQTEKEGLAGGAPSKKGRLVVAEPSWSNAVEILGRAEDESAAATACLWGG